MAQRLANHHGPSALTVVLALVLLGAALRPFARAHGRPFGLAQGRLGSGRAQAATGNIDAADKWAWGTNVGWINFAPSDGGVTVYADHLEGYAWGENVGWIRLGTYSGGFPNTYANDAADNYGVNRDVAGNLSGYAWGASVGWIDFDPTHGGVTIDRTDGSFDGYAWGENVGWISFSGTAQDDTAYQVVTTYIPPLPDLEVAKGNNGTPVGLSGAWEWRLVVTNNGTGNADFADGDTILSDQLPSAGATYGAVTVDDQTGITGTIDCAISASDLLTCTANGAVTIDASPGTIRARFTATPTAVGTFTNPTGGDCEVDPGDQIDESSEGNNGCNSDAVVVYNDSVLINEVDCDTPGSDAAEFVELYDGGAGNSALDGLVLVFFEGASDVSYEAFDLDGQTTDGDGFFVVGNSGVPGVDLAFADGVLQNGADAVALYAGDASDFPNGTAVITANLLDALVYDTGQPDDAGLLALLNDGQPQVDEGGSSDSDNHSMQRLPNGTGGQRNTNTYAMFSPTSAAANVNTPPSVSSIALASPDPTNAASVDFAVAFSESVSGVDDGDFTLASTGDVTGTVSSVVGSGTTRTVTVSAITGDGDLRLDLTDDDTITDGVDPLGPGDGSFTSGESYSIDNTAPTATSFARQTPGTSPTNADTLVFRAVFDEDVQDVDAGDFTANGASTATATGVAQVSASVVDVTVAGGDLAGFNGSVGIDLSGGQDISDLVGNALPAGEPDLDETYTLDNDAPGLTSFAWQTPPTSPTNADTLVFRATFDEGVQDVDAADFSVDGTSTAAATGVAQVSAGEYDVTVSGGDLAGFNGTLGVDLAVGQNIIDPAGNALPAVEPGTDQTYLLDNLPPAPDIDQAAGQTDPTSTQPINFEVDFGESVSGFTAASLALGGTAPGTRSAVVTGGPSSHNVAVYGVAGGGTVTVSVAAGAVQDLSGNVSSASTATDDQVTFVTADLVIAKSVASTVVRAGQMITYSITFSNTGTALASDIFVTDVVPVSVTVTAVISSGVAIVDTGAAPPYVWEVADLAVGEGGAITITGQLSTTLPTSRFTNTAVITTTTLEEDITNNSSDAAVMVLAPGAMVETAAGTGTAAFWLGAGGIQGLDAVAEETLACPEEGKPDLDFAHGFFSFSIAGLTPCASETVVVTITLPAAVPPGTEYWKCHDGAWVDVSSLLGDNDGDEVLTLTLTDGGLGDDDGDCNGVIVDDGGPGLPVPVGGVIVPVDVLGLRVLRLGSAHPFWLAVKALVCLALGAAALWWPQKGLVPPSRRRRRLGRQT